MTATLTTPDRPGIRAGSDGFGRVLHAEWTKFRTVRGWIAGVIAGVLVMLGLGLFAAGNAQIACSTAGGPALTGKACLPHIPYGPGGEAVVDSFSFVRQPLAGNGSITTRVTSLTGRYANNSGPVQAGQGGSSMVPGLQPWSKAGLIIKASTRQGSAYAAILVTGGHGVRMQYNYTGDIAGMPGAVSASSPRWLRLTRSGDTVTGYDSADGSHWAKVGTVALAGLPSTVQAGLFATSPQALLSSGSGGRGATMTPSQDAAVFDHVGLADGWTSGTWTGTGIGTGIKADYPVQGASYTHTGGRFSLTGSGDIAPAISGSGESFPTMSPEQHLVGAFAGLIAMVVVAAMFITVEYRRGLIRTTFAANPWRGQVLAAKAVVAGLATFVAGLATTAIVLPIGISQSTERGMYVPPVSLLTEVRIVAGTAALLAAGAVLAVAIGALTRRSAVAVTTVIVAIVLPYILSMTVLPANAADWVMRITPAAGFAIQQSVHQWAQINAPYTPANGYFPLAPWAGFAVLWGYAAVALAGACYALNRRDA